MRASLPPPVIPENAAAFLAFLRPDPVRAMCARPGFVPDWCRVR